MIVNLEQEVLASDTDPDSSISKIRAIVEMTKEAQKSAIEMDMKFEAYLLDMAVFALSEQLEKHEKANADIADCP